MPRIIEIIESKHWVNVETGRTASIYGAVPYTNDQDKLNWRIESRGYTWRLNNGTIGLGRSPAKTLSEALEVMVKVNSLYEEKVG